MLDQDLFETRKAFSLVLRPPEVGKNAILDAFARLIGSLIDRKYPTQGTHSERVAILACRIGKRINLPPETVRDLYLAGMLHDIGKLLIPANIVFKEGVLDDDERETVKVHPLIGARLLENMPLFADIAPDVLHHHERIDGKGYPRGLRGEDIPLNARIISVAEAFDVMTEGIYKEPVTMEVAFEELTRGSGRQFDGGVVQALIKEIEEGHPLSTCYTGSQELCPDPSDLMD